MIVLTIDLSLNCRVWWYNSREATSQGINTKSLMFDSVLFISAVKQRSGESFDQQTNY